MRRFTFRRARRDDFGLLATWLAQPHVARWWYHEFTPEAVERDFGQSADGLEPSQDHLALLDGVPVGLLQFCHLADYPEYIDEIGDLTEVPMGAGSIDYLLGESALLGQGLGTAMIASFVEQVWSTEPALACLIVPVNSANVASWRALLAAGFRVLARGDIPPDNPIDDPLHEILRLDRPL